MSFACQRLAHRVACTLIMGFMAPAAHAATVEAGFRLRVDDDFRNSARDEDFRSVFGTTFDPNGGPTIERSGSDSLMIGGDTVGAAQGSYGYDVTTGELRVLAGASVVCGLNCFDQGNFFSANAGANARMSSGFTAIGDGTVTFFTAFEGAWNVSATAVGGSPSINATGGLFLTTGSGRILDSATISYSPITESDLSDPDNRRFSALFSQAPDELLSVSFDVVAGQRYGVEQSVNVSTARGLVDFTNTVTLSFETTPGLSLAFDDAQFLSVDPDAGAPVAPIPLPAAGWMLLAGLGALAAASRRR